MDQKFSFWIANIVAVLGHLQHEITKLSVDPNMIVVSNDQKMTAPLVVLLQMRSEAARNIEELYRSWLAELCKWFGSVGPSAVLEYQGLAGYTIERSAEFKPASILNSILGRRPSSTAVTIDVLIDGLDELLLAMSAARLPREITEQLVNAVLSHIFAVCFNELVMRKSFATWRRGIQIQYNLSQLEDWSNRTGFGFRCAEPLLQAVKLLQLAKTATTEDIPVIMDACPALNTHQIRRIFSIYVPGEFEDGPVCSALMRALAVRCQQDELASRASELVVPVVHAESDPLQLSILPIAPSGNRIPPSQVPPTLWKLFVLVEASHSS